MLTIYDFSIDYIKNPAVVNTENLRFGWKLRSDRKNVLQDRYQIVIAGVADSGIVKDSRVCDHTLPSLSLSPLCDYTVTVTVWDNHGETAAFSHVFSTALSDEQWADAKWIKPAVDIQGRTATLTVPAGTTCVSETGEVLGSGEHHLTF